MYKITYPTICSATHIQRACAKDQTKKTARLLIGCDDVSFFAVDNEGNQINIKKIGVGVIGEGGVYSKTILL